MATLIALNFQQVGYNVSCVQLYKRSLVSTLDGLFVPSKLPFLLVSHSLARSFSLPPSLSSSLPQLFNRVFEMLQCKIISLSLAHTQSRTHTHAHTLGSSYVLIFLRGLAERFSNYFIRLRLGLELAAQYPS